MSHIPQLLLSREGSFQLRAARLGLEPFEWQSAANPAGRGARLYLPGAGSDMLQELVFEVLVSVAVGHVLAGI